MSFKSNKGILLSSQYLKIAITPACVSFKFKRFGKTKRDQIQRQLREAEHHFVRINLVIQQTSGLIGYVYFGMALRDKVSCNSAKITFDVHHQYRYPKRR
jgi:hypothetical protein